MAEYDFKEAGCSVNYLSILSENLFYYNNYTEDRSLFSLKMAVNI